MAMIDTHREVENLISRGLEKKIAEAIIDVHTKNQEELATKSDIAMLRSDMNSIKTELKSEITLVESNLKSEISGIHHKIDSVESRSENKIDLINSNIGWLKATNIAILATVLSIALAPIAQNMFKAPVQEAAPVVPSKK